MPSEKYGNIMHYYKNYNYFADPNKQIIEEYLNNLPNCNISLKNLLIKGKRKYLCT